MQNLVRILLVAVAVFAMATALTSIKPRAQRNSPYAPVPSLAGVQEARAAKPLMGPGCQRTCGTTGCVWIAKRPSSCYVVNAETCVEEPCQ